MNACTSKVIDCFSEKFSSPANIYFSPGRINLIGEHVDYNDGFVLPAAIDKGIYYAIAPNQTGIINFYAMDYNEDLSIDIQHIKKGTGWKNYVLAVVNEFLIAGKDVYGFDCVFAGDIPQGSGMSSSAAVECGLAFALNDIFNCGLNRVELALLCQRAEHNFPGVQCGIMDMYTSLNGKKGHVLLLDCRNITHEYFPLTLKGYKILLLNSKVHHSLASGEYNVRRQNCETGLNILKEKLHVNSFRDITDVAGFDACKELMTAEVFSCCQYVIEEIIRTKKAAYLLRKNEIDAFGKLMYETHEGLSRLYKVSCAELDLLVDQAKTDINVVGARLMGGGFGGCTINIVKEEFADDFIDKACNAFQDKFEIKPEAYIVQTADGTGRISF